MLPMKCFGIAEPVGECAVLLGDVLPQIFLLSGLPAIVPLIQRYLKLAILGHQIAEGSLCSKHSLKIASTGAVGCCQ